MRKAAINGWRACARRACSSGGCCTIAVGADKFTNLLANWDQYLAPAIAGMLPFSAHTFMLVVGVIEIVAGIWVFCLPRIFAYVVSAWLVGGKK